MTVEQTRLVLVGIGVAALLIALIGRRHSVPLLKAFFTEPSHPVNLALFRIVICVTLLIWFDRASIQHYSQYPRVLQYPPSVLWMSLVNYFPLTPAFASVAFLVFQVSCIAVLIGLQTRWSAVILLVSALYISIIPQLFGKVNHYHHLIWFTALLAASRSGDALSVDQIIRAVRQKLPWYSQPDASAISVRYGLPLRFVALLIGVLYFFPGLYKLWDIGFDWIASDNLKWLMYLKWSELRGWLPFWRIDEYPLIYQLTALYTVVFEIGFIFVILSRRLRPFAALVGLAFHNATSIFLNISFWPLQVCYVALFDWYGLWMKLRGWLAQRANKALPATSHPLPATATTRPAVRLTTVLPILLTGFVLFFGNIYTGIARSEDYPFGLYPTFAFRALPETQTLVIDAYDTAGNVVVLTESDFSPEASPERLRALLYRVLGEPDERRQERLRALWSMWVHDNPKLKDISRVQFFSVSLSTVPEDQARNPLRRDMVYEFSPAVNVVVQR